MEPRELLDEALRAIRSHPLRSFLTLLGIIIGVATLVGVVSVISGLNAYVTDKVFSLSPDVFVISKFGIIRSREEFLAALKRRNLTYADYRKLAATLRQAEQVAVSANGTVAVRFRDRRLADVTLRGTSANFGRVMNIDIESGRFFSDSEARTASLVAVIGWDVKDELFRGQDPVGRTILVGGVPARVVGTIAEQGKSLGQSRDNEVYLPIDLYRKSFGASGRDSYDIYVQARGGVAGVDDSADEARSVLRALRHTSFRDGDPFSIITAESLQDLWRQISAAGFLLSILIASVSLGVGGIVIMNIMLVAVAERTQEIGLRLAIGARKRDIRLQFLLEAALLSLAGGLAGVFAGAGVALSVDRFLHFPSQPTPAIVLLGLALSCAVGLAAGYWPARSASNLAAIDALRAE